jgi:hypothetical protein
MGLFCLEIFIPMNINKKTLNKNIVVVDKRFPTPQQLIVAEGARLLRDTRES